MLARHRHKPENYGEGSIRALQCGKLQRFPKLRTSGIPVKQELPAGGSGPGRRNVFGNKQLVWEDRAVEILESRISKDVLKTYTRYACTSAENGFSTDRNGELSVTLAVNG